MTEKSSPTTLRLGLEELVVVIGLMGYPEIAKGLLVSQLGELIEDEERGRLLAANHSLMARDLLYLQGDQVRMKPAYARLLSFLTVNDYVVRASIRPLGRLQQTLNIYGRGDQLVSQHVTDEVVYTFGELDGVAQAQDTLMTFLTINGSQPFEVAPFVLDNAHFEEARLMAADGQEALSTYLQDQKVSQGPAALLAQDMHEETMRAAVMNVSVDATAGLVADHGYLILQGKSGRVWLMDIKDMDGSVRLVIQAGAKELLYKASRKLFVPAG